MNEPSHIEPQPIRRLLFGLGALGGMLVFTCVTNIFQMHFLHSILSGAGALGVLMFYIWMERDIPRGVDNIASEVSQWPERERSALSEYLRDDE